MTTIWMDPEQVKGAAATLGELVMQIQETMTGTRSECICEVPRSLIGWLDEELQAITVGALQAALGYLEQAVEVKNRADALQADQSLVTMLAAPPVPTATGGPVWDPRYGWVSTAPLPTGMPTEPVGQPGSGLAEVLSRPDIAANDVATGAFGDDIIAILKMGVPGGGAGGGATGDPNILADIAGRDSAIGNLNASWGGVYHHRYMPDIGRQGYLYGGNQEPRTSPEPVPPPTPSPPSGV